MLFSFTEFGLGRQEFFLRGDDFVGVALLVGITVLRLCGVQLKLGAGLDLMYQCAFATLNQLFILLILGGKLLDTFSRPMLLM